VTEQQPEGAPPAEPDKDNPFAFKVNLDKLPSIPDPENKPKRYIPRAKGRPDDPDEIPSADSGEEQQ